VYYALKCGSIPEPLSPSSANDGDDDDHGAANRRACVLHVTADIVQAPWEVPTTSLDHVRDASDAGSAAAAASATDGLAMLERDDIGNAMLSFSLALSSSCLPHYPALEVAYRLMHTDTHTPG